MLYLIEEESQANIECLKQVIDSYNYWYWHRWHLCFAIASQTKDIVDGMTDGYSLLESVNAGEVDLETAKLLVIGLRQEEILTGGGAV